MKNFTVMFLMLFVASILGGLALNGAFRYSMLVGVSLASFFLFGAVISQWKRN